MHEELFNKELEEMTKICLENDRIDPELYTKYDVKRGLRDLDGNGVRAGLTKICDVNAKKIVDGKEVPCEGKLFYRGYNVEELVKGFIRDNRFGFEEIIYLLLFGVLPDASTLASFKDMLGQYRKIPQSFVRDVIMESSSPNIMNSMAKCVLTLYAHDKKADDTSLPNVLRQCIQLISQFPQLAVYSYQGYQYYYCDKSFIVHAPIPELSTAENILHMLRADSKYTELEAKILDIALVLHAEHGGGNNSSFTTHVITSTGTDTYSVIAASLGSLKGPLHGGANIKVIHMFEDMKEQLGGNYDEDSIRAYLNKLLDKEAFDKKGVIYGIGHAVYSLSDPRAVIFKSFVEKLAVEKGYEKEFRLYSAVERIAPEIISERRRIYKGVSANVDFYSGFVYKMLGLPEELYTPLFAIARIAGWSAHRIEELINANKIIRPAYKSISEHTDYMPMSER